MGANKLGSKDIPKNYKGHVTSTRIISNIYKFINYVYDSDITRFKKSYRALLGGNKNRLTENEIESKLSSLSQKLRGSNGRLLKLSDSEHLENIFFLPAGSLTSPEVNREVAYMFLDCSPKDTLKVFDYLTKYGKSCDILDECSLVSGDSDVFLRLYGTKHEVKQFLADILGNTPGLTINKTKTHFSFSNEVWQKYPIKENTNKINKRPYWLPNDWSRP